MNIELTDLEEILLYLETTSLEPHNDYTSEFTYKDQKILYKYIKQLQQENKQLKEIIKENTILVKDEYGDYQECNINPLDMKQKYEKQLDNWNKLKEYIETIYKGCPPYEKEVLMFITNKIQELEQGSDSNVKD